MSSTPRSRIETLQDRIANSRELTDDDREVLETFSRHIDVLGQAEYSEHRHEKLLRHCTRMAEEVGGLADALTDRKAAEGIVAWINTTYDNPETNRDYRVALRVFGKRVGEADPDRFADGDVNDDGYPKAVEWISAKTPKNYDPTPNGGDMLDWDDDVLPMIEQGARNRRDAALFAVAFEGGFRGGELRDIRLRDVRDDKLGKYITVDGKTGEREVLIAGDAVVYLNRWLAEHPDHDNPDAYLWCKRDGSGRASHQTFIKYFKRAAARADITKPVTPTNFRKSNATWLAKRGMNAGLIEDRQGRRRGSDAVARYVARFGTDADDEYVAKIHGYELEDADPDDRTPNECTRCGELTPHHRDTCMECGLPFDPMAAYEAGANAPKQTDMDAFKAEMQEFVFETLAKAGNDPEALAAALAEHDSDDDRTRPVDDETAA